MPDSLYWNTVTPLLKEGLLQLMDEPLFNRFRLVGGTSLSLQVGHRMSVDIDLFTDAPYGSVNFEELDGYLRSKFQYVSPAKLPDIVAIGVSYILGNNEQDSFKLDLFYTDNFIRPEVVLENVRLAAREEIIAMKVDVIQRRGRKKDFWDLHELLNNYSIDEMVALHLERYPYGHDEALILQKFADFELADSDFDPVCLKEKQWQIIKLDFFEALKG